MIRETSHLTRPTEYFIKGEYNKISEQIKDTNQEILNLINYYSPNDENIKLIKKLFSPFVQEDNQVNVFIKQQDKQHISFKTSEQLYRQKIAHINEYSIKDMFRIISKRLRTKKEFDKDLLYNIKSFLKELFDIERNGFYSKEHNLHIADDDFFLYKEPLLLETEQEFLEFGNFSDYIKNSLSSDMGKKLNTLLESDDFMHIHNETLKEVKGIIVEYIDRVYYYKTKAEYGEIRIKRKVLLKEIENIRKKITKDLDITFAMLQN